MIAPTCPYRAGFGRAPGSPTNGSARGHPHTPEVPRRWLSTQVGVDDADRLHQRVHRGRPDEREPAPLAAPWTAPATPSDVRRHLGVRRRGRVSASGRNDHTRSTRPPSARSATVARALVIVASTLRRLRTMPASAISRSTSRVVVRRDRLGVEAVERRAERRPLAQDRRPGQPGLERLQAEPLEHARARRGPASPTRCRSTPASAGRSPPTPGGPDRRHRAPSCSQPLTGCALPRRGQVTLCWRPCQ